MHLGTSLDLQPLSLPTSNAFGYHHHNLWNTRTILSTQRARNLSHSFGYCMPLTQMFHHMAFHHISSLFPLHATAVAHLHHILHYICSNHSKFQPYNQRGMGVDCMSLSAAVKTGFSKIGLVWARFGPRHAYMGPYSAHYRPIVWATSKPTVSC